MIKLVLIIGLCLFCILLGLVIALWYLSWKDKCGNKKHKRNNLSSLISFLKKNNFDYEDVSEHGNIYHKFYPISFDVTNNSIGYVHIKKGWIWLENDTVDKAKSSIRAAITYCKIHYKKSNAPFQS